VNRFYLRLVNSLGCEIETYRVDVPEGQDHSPAIRTALIRMIQDSTPEPGDVIRIEEVS
jgi:hypothetical protein